MCSVRDRRVRAPGWSWTALACAICMPWCCGCGKGTCPAIAGNGLGGDLLSAGGWWPCGQLPVAPAMGGRGFHHRRRT